MQLEYNNITVRFSEHSTPTVVLTDDGQTYVTPREITAIVDGVLRIDGHIYTDATYTLARTNAYEFWTLRAGHGTLIRTEPDRTDIPEDIIKAIELFEENFS